MNLLLGLPDVREGCRALARASPLVARKQLLEACQILASVERHLTGTTTMLRQDGQLYKFAHRHHPITLYCAASVQSFDLALGMADELAQVYPNHACARSLASWQGRGLGHDLEDLGYVVCRLGHPRVQADTLHTYAGLIRPYLRDAKNINLTPEQETP